MPPLCVCGQVHPTTIDRSTEVHREEFVLEEKLQRHLNLTREVQLVETDAPVAITGTGTAKGRSIRSKRNRSIRIRCAWPTENWGVGYVKGFSFELQPRSFFNHKLLRQGESELWPPWRANVTHSRNASDRCVWINTLDAGEASRAFVIEPLRVGLLPG